MTSETHINFYNKYNEIVSALNNIIENKFRHRETVFSLSPDMVVTSGLAKFINKIEDTKKVYFTIDIIHGERHKKCCYLHDLLNLKLDKDRFYNFRQTRYIFFIPFDEFDILYGLCKIYK